MQLGYTSLGDKVLNPLHSMHRHTKVKVSHDQAIHFSSEGGNSEIVAELCNGPNLLQVLGNLSFGPSSACKIL